MSRRTIPVCMIALVVACGCRTKRIQVVMERTADDAVRRTITIHVSESSTDKADLSPGEVEALRGIYGKESRDSEGKTTFTKTFRGDLPSDIFAAGSRSSVVLTRLVSPMGRTECYLERMPGPARPLDILTAGSKVLDVSVQALVAYAEHHLALKDEPDKLERVKQFLEHEFRDDAANVLLLSWLTMPETTLLDRGGAIGERPWEEGQAVVGMFLMDRGYLKREDAPFAFSGHLHSRLVPGVLRKLADALGHPADEGLPPELARFAENPELIFGAFEEGLKHIGMTWKQFMQLLDEAFETNPMEFTSVDVIWRFAKDPVRTNGTVDAKGRIIHWELGAARRPSLANVLLATWATPDESYQRTRLGKVALNGTDLEDYNAWYATLGREEAKSWNAFLDELRPGVGLTEKLRSFRFPDKASTRPAASQPNGPEEVKGAALIIIGLSR